MNIYNQKSEKGFKEGIQAALMGDTELVKQKTRHGMNLEDTDEYSRSVLHYAVLGGNLEMVRYLVLNCQMDPTFADKWLVTPYDLALEPENNEVLEKDSADDIYRTYYFDVPKDRLPIYNFFKEYLGFSLSDSYRNPVLRSFHADPSIVRVGDDFYMVNSSFIYFPGIPISHSKDLVHWELIGYAVTDPDWAAEHLGPLEGGRGFWAPDISYHDGRFYICATLRNNDNMEYPQTQIVTSSDKPEGPYDEPVIHNVSGIDPSLFTDDDGKRYMLLNRGACLMEVSSDGQKILSDPEMIAYGWSGHAPEGPHLLKKDGYYYCFLAEGGTGRGHMITVLRSRNLKGPYENCPYNPIMTQKDPIAPIQCCGHGKPVMTGDGRWFMVYLCERMIDGKWGMLGRETAIDEITWTADGWPIVNKRRGPSYLAKLPFGSAGSKPETDGQLILNEESNRESNEESDIESGKECYKGSGKESDIILRKSELPYGGWLFTRTCDKDYVNVLENGSILLKGDGRDLCDIKCKSFGVYNQKELVCTDSIVMTRSEDTKDLSDSYNENTCLEDSIKENSIKENSFEENSFEKTSFEEAGMTLYYDENSYIKFGIREYDDKRCKVVVAEYKDDKYIYEKLYDTSYKNKKDNVFTVLTDNTTRTLILNGSSICTLTDVTGICSEGLKKGKRFTSATVGVYVYGINKYIFKKLSDT